MSKTVVTQQGFVDACNASLTEHESFQEGMTFLLFPDGAPDGQASGIGNTGPDELTSVYAQVYHQNCERFVVGR